jgi:hypothetical protein
MLQKALGGMQTEGEKDRFRQLLEFVRIGCCISPHANMFFSDTLRPLFQMCGSDKHQYGAHQYGYTYDALFRRFKYKQLSFLNRAYVMEIVLRRVLECGKPISHSRLLLGAIY